MNSLGNWNTLSNGTGVPAPNGAFSDPVHNWNINGQSSGTVAANWALAGDLEASNVFTINLNSGVSFTLGGDYIGYTNFFIIGTSNNIVGYSGSTVNMPSMTSISTLQLSGTATKIARTVINVANILFSGSTQLNMVTYNLSATIGVNGGGSRHIPPGQAFWIQASSTPGANLTLSYSQTDPTNNTSILKTTPDHAVLQLTDDQGAQIDEIAVRFDQSATSHFDPELDAHKLGAGNGIPYIYIMQNGEAYSICSNTDSVTIYNVHINENNGPQQMRLSLKYNDLQSFTDVYLEDLITGTITRLSDGGHYSFAHTDQDDEDRFRLIFSNESIGIDEDLLTSVTASVVDDQLYIFNSDELQDLKVDIVDLNGRLLEQLQWQGSPLDLSHLKAGIYLARLYTNDTAINTQRILVK